MIKKKLKISWVSKYSKDLEADYPTLVKRVKLQILLDELKEQNNNICFRCGKKIDKYTGLDGLSIEHMVGFINKTEEEIVELFSDPKNLSFSHLRCNCSAGGRSNRKSEGYTGIENFNKDKGYFRIKVNYKGHQFSLGSFTNEVEAAELFDLVNLKYHNIDHSLNFPWKLDNYKKRIQDGWKSELFETKCNLIDFPETMAKLAVSSLGKSKYRGVDKLWNRNKDKWRWRMSIVFNKKISKNFTNLDEDEKLAAMLYDLLNFKLRKAKGGLNFPENIELYKNTRYDETELDRSIDYFRSILDL